MADRAPLVIVSGSWQQIQSGDYIANSWINWASPGNIGTTLAASANFSSVTIPSALGGLSAAGAGVLGLSASSTIAVEIRSDGGAGRVKLSGVGSSASVGTSSGDLLLDPASGLVQVTGAVYTSSYVETTGSYTIGAYDSSGWKRRGTTTPFRLATEYYDVDSVSFLVAASGTGGTAITWIEALRFSDAGLMTAPAGLKAFAGTATLEWSSTASGTLLARSDSVFSLQGISYNASFGSYIELCRGRGTIASPATAQNGDTVGVILFRAVKAALSLSNAADITAVLTAAESGGYFGTDIIISTSAAGSAPSERVRINSTGMDVTGALTVNGAPVGGAAGKVFAARYLGGFN